MADAKKKRGSRFLRAGIGILTGCLVILISVMIYGFPAGIRIDMDFVQAELNRRRPGQSLITTARRCV